MLIDQVRGALFIKTNKTAGTSLEIALSRWMDPFHSVITPISPEDEDLRRRLGGHGPCGFRHFEAPAPLQPRIGFSRAPTGCTFYNHMSYGEIVATLGPDTIEPWWSFGFTRHPFSRALSIYTFRHRRQPSFSQLGLEEHRKLFEAFLQQGHLQSTAQALITRNGHRVTTIFRFEALKEAIATIATRWSLPSEQLLPLPRAKTQYGQALLPFPREELLTPAARDLIERSCHWEFEHHYASTADSSVPS